MFCAEGTARTKHREWSMVRVNSQNRMLIWAWEQHGQRAGGRRWVGEVGRGQLSRAH